MFLLLLLYQYQVSFSGTLTLDSMRDVMSKGKERFYIIQIMCNVENHWRKLEIEVEN